MVYITITRLPVSPYYLSLTTTSSTTKTGTSAFIHSFIHSFIRRRRQTSMGVSASSSVVASSDERVVHHSSDDLAAHTTRAAESESVVPEDTGNGNDEGGFVTNSDDDNATLMMRALRNAIEQPTSRTSRQRFNEPSTTSSSSWRVVFDSNRHGLSFGALARACVGDALAPLALLVEPTNRGDDDDAPVRAVYLANGVPDGPRCEMFGDPYAVRAFELAPTKKTFRDVSRPVGSKPCVYFAYGFDAHVNGFGVFGRPGRHVVFLDDKLENAHYDYGARSVSIARVVAWVRRSNAKEAESQTRKETTTTKAKAARTAETYRLMSQYTESSINRDATASSRF